MKDEDIFKHFDTLIEIIYCYFNTHKIPPLEGVALIASILEEACRHREISEDGFTEMLIKMRLNYFEKDEDEK